MSGFTGITPLRSPPINPNLSATSYNRYHLPSHFDSVGRLKLLGALHPRDWYAADVAFAGKEMSSWAGVEHQSRRGEEVSKTVEALWDPRGWECLWVGDLHQDAVKTMIS